MNSKVSDYLFRLNEVETVQKNTGIFQMDLPQESFQYTNQKLILSEDYFLKNDRIYISKHNRFAPYPEHTHTFLELNYMLKGSCNQTINGKFEELNEGEVLLLDKGSSHSIEALGEDDLLINIIFPQSKFDSEWLSSLNAHDNRLFQFLMKRVSENQRNHYILFKSGQNVAIQTILNQMLNTYFTDTVFGEDILRFYLPILFMELVGHTDYSLDTSTRERSVNQVIIEALRLIEKDYASLSLEALASRLNYSISYLSELIKKSTGKTFSDLMTEERLKNARLLIESTDLPIEKVIHRVGLQNKTYFYRKFKAFYGESPGAFRKRMG